MKAGASEAQIEAVYRSRSPAFLRTVTALLGDGEAALDAVQDGFARALRHRERFRGESSVETWLWRIVLNAARDRQRSASRRPPVADEGAFFDGGDETRVPIAELRASLRALPERQRIAVFLRYYADMSYEEIAETLGTRPGTVAASLHIAHTTLRRRLGVIPG